VRGADAQEALRRAERAVDLLDQARARGLVEEVSTVTRLLPSEARQEANLAAHDAALEARVRAEAEAQGFAPGYFEPFSADLAAARAGAVPPIRPEDFLGSRAGGVVPPLSAGLRPAARSARDFAGTPLAALVQRGLHVDADGAEASIVVHTGRGGAGPARLAPQVEGALTALGATVVSGAALAERVVGAVKDSVANLAGLSLFLVGLALLAYYRRPGRALLALLPAALGLLWAAGVVGLSGVPFNIVSVGAFALVSGMGVDYGIFVTDALVSPEPDAWPATLRSVILAAVTTLLGFGSLVLADNPVMWSLGFAVAVGIVASLLAAAVVLPALYRVGLGRAEAARSIPALVGLAALAGLSVAVVAVWATGARSAYQGEVVVALVVNLACIAWIVKRSARHG
ncbi:MAG: MMPL family transporter, partial [Myxococcales bacterium]|nr:MMPL family transporter [Myxococcales bacterium]